MVTVLPIAVVVLIDTTPGVVRSQLVQVRPATLRLRLSAVLDADIEAVSVAYRTRRPCSMM
jgi:hypothetical protein